MNMLNYSLEVFKQFIEVLKVFIPLYLLFDLIGDLLFRHN